ncbi:uncharacterized protein LOC135079559 [Ostrinia nubilalis]|uniref:uncharacterized protein LOC135079559 n=1 Tax=Ostrinia nubilalis TaxID=29057 RepID=UPI0030823977
MSVSLKFAPRQFSSNVTMSVSVFIAAVILAAGTQVLTQNDSELDYNFIFEEDKIVPIPLVTTEKSNNAPEAVVATTTNVPQVAKPGVSVSGIAPSRLNGSEITTESSSNLTSKKFGKLSILV